ncbi:MAG TPA: trypsin-like peptidase domain-containing protein [Candidatus Dormibacteraeota bacterium]|nr:trypsin-like peptidase domain-containing protein [Candidatus Dormibacteraeota bacterium]
MTYSNFPDPQRPTGDQPWAPASPPPVSWQPASDQVPPPPPPPPGYAPGGWQWHQPPVEPRRRGRRVFAGTLAAIFVVGIGSGVAVARLTNDNAPLGSSVANNPSTGNGTGGSGSSGTALDPNAVAAKVTPGIVNINVTLGTNGAAAGTGMVITSTGEVLTNNHVIDGETSVTVELPSTGKSYSAHVLGYDLTEDVALVQIDGGGSFTTVSVGNSSSVNVGDAVVALGNALGRNGAPSVTTGQVTALDRTITASDQAGGDPETVTGLIQADAEIQPGDSGGPLATASGTVIGMDTAAQTAGQFNQQGSTVAYAIPINKALSIVKQIQSGQDTANVHVGNTRALLGVGGQTGGGGVQVITVQSGSAAANAGITVGSTITALNGTSISSNAALRNAIVQHNPGTSISVTWTDTGGHSHTAQVTLGTGPPA